MLTPGATLEPEKKKDNDYMSVSKAVRMAQTIDVDASTTTGKQQRQGVTNRRQTSSLGWKQLARKALPTSVNSSIVHLSSHEAAGDPLGLHIEYGEMLPKVGVKSLPDYKVLAFLRVLSDII
jgi:hypothetical protein